MAYRFVHPLICFSLCSCTLAASLFSQPSRRHWPHCLCHCPLMHLPVSSRQSASFPHTVLATPVTEFFSSLSFSWSYLSHCLAFLFLSFPDSLVSLFRRSFSLDIGIIWDSGVGSVWSSSHTVFLVNSSPFVGLTSVLVILSTLVCSQAYSWTLDQDSWLLPKQLYLDIHELPAFSIHSFLWPYPSSLCFLSQWMVPSCCISQDSGNHLHSWDKPDLGMMYSFLLYTLLNSVC